MSHQLYSLGSGINGNFSYSGTLGNLFTVGASDITVDSLGAFVSASAGWTSPKGVALWRQVDQVLLATVSIAPGEGTRVGQFALKGINPVTIPAGTACMIGAWGYGGDPFQWADQSSGVPLAADTGAGLVALTGHGATLPTAGAYPTSLDSSGAAARFGAPTMTYSGVGGSPSFVLDPATVAAGTPQAVTATGTSTAWTSGTTFSVSGGAGASISGLSVNAGAQTATFTLNPGSAAGTLTVADSTDSATATVNTVTSSLPAFAGPLALSGNVPGAGVTVSYPAATGGLGTKTYRLYRSSSPMATPASGTLAASGTGPTLTDPTPGAGVAYYLATVTDSAGSATSRQSGNQACLVVAPKSAQINVVNMGDSITAGVGASDQAHAAASLLRGLMAQAFPTALVTGGGGGVNGTTAADWVNGTNGANIGYTTGALVSGALNLVAIQFGTNDAQASKQFTPAAYKANVASLCASVIAAGATPILFPPPYLVPGALNLWDEAHSLPLLTQYRDQLVALADNATIFLGGASTFEEFTALYQAGGSTYTADGVHPSDAGHAILANLWFAGVARVAAVKTGLVPSSSGGSGAGITLAQLNNALASIPVTLAASQPNYAPATATAMASGLAALAAEIGTPAQVGQIPAAFTASLFASPGVFSTAALANGPAGPGTGTGTGIGATAPAGWVNAASLAADAIQKIQQGLSTYAGGPVASVTAPVTVGTVNDKAGYALAPAGLDAIQVEAGVNARQALSPILAACAGVVAGAGTGVVVIKGGNSPTTRISAITDNAGNRSSVNLILPS